MGKASGNFRKSRERVRILQKHSFYTTFMNHVVNGTFPEILPGVDVIPEFVWVGATVVRYVNSGCMFDFNRVCLLVRNGEQIRHYVMVARSSHFTTPEQTRMF